LVLSAVNALKPFIEWVELSNHLSWFFLRCSAEEAGGSWQSAEQWRQISKTSSITSPNKLQKNQAQPSPSDRWLTSHFSASVRSSMAVSWQKQAAQEGGRWPGLGCREWFV
jgi:hypothetical protein